MFQTSIEFETLAPPKNQLAAVLKMLIEKNEVSERDTVFNGFRSRISDLRKKHYLNIRHTVVKYINQYNRASSYRKHYLLTIDREKAVEVYNKINQ